MQENIPDFISYYYYDLFYDDGGCFFTGLQRKS